MKQTKGRKEEIKSGPKYNTSPKSEGCCLLVLAERPKMFASGGD